MPTSPTHHAPNAALLIDFDNVTLGIRSDLTKELRTLLNSDIIKGKVAVQRAYADWRRYPQYIVSLSESSIDLIFAPAFGTAKKNATDIRLAVDAIELVFTRPEIGTFILLSGDSDFSSMVLKLKEYGKYVIGVGIRESASDLLIQNCDEYFSYSDLAGLSKESDQPTAPRDPWELVVEAVKKMVDNRDVMRSDRLKQVMQQIDPNFDERSAGPGYNRFSKFVAEAAHRGLISVSKQENGQFDVSPAVGSKDRDEGRGTRDEGPGTKDQRTATATVPAGEGGGRRRRGRGRGRGRGAEEGGEVSATEVTAPAAAPRAARPAARPASGRPARAPAPTELTLAEAFQLMSRALGELPTPVAHETVRARMAALYGREDPLLEAPRFGKLLRQANDAEVADVRQLDENRYEVSQHKADIALQMRSNVEAMAPSDTASITEAMPITPRFRGGARISSTRNTPPPMVGVIELNPTVSPTPAAEAPVEAQAARTEERVPARKVPVKKAAAPTAPAAKAAARPKKEVKAAAQGSSPKKTAPAKTPVASRPTRSKAP